MAGNPLTASLLFAPKSRRDQILSLRCVASEIAAAASDSNDAAVAGARLQWWTEALADPDHPHPALRALVVSGASDCLRPGDFHGLLDGVAASLQQPRFERFSQLWDFSCRIGGSVAELEVKLLGGNDSTREVFRELGGAQYLIRIVRDLVIDARANRWLVPLDIQADYQVSRQDALSDRASPAMAGLVRAMLAEAVGRGQRAVARLDRSQRVQQLHLLALWALDRRLAGQIDRRPGRLFRERVLPGYWGNIWTAWRAARHALKA